MIDLLHFIVSLRRRQAGVNQGAAIAKVAAGGLLKASDHASLARYADGVGLAPRSLDFWLRVYWFTLLKQHMRFNADTLSRAARDNVLQPAIDALRVAS